MKSEARSNISAGLLLIFHQTYQFQSTGCCVQSLIGGHWGERRMNQMNSTELPFSLPVDPLTACDTLATEWCCSIIGLIKYRWTIECVAQWEGGWGGEGGSLGSEQASQMNSAQQDVTLFQCLPNTCTVPMLTCYLHCSSVYPILALFQCLQGIDIAVV